MKNTVNIFFAISFILLLSACGNEPETNPVIDPGSNFDFHSSDESSVGSIDLETYFRFYRNLEDNLSSGAGNTENKFFQ